MKASRLKQILESAEQGIATVNDAVEIAGAALSSTSRSNTEIKQMIQEVMKMLTAMQAQIDFLYQNNSPIYAAILEDDAEEEFEGALDSDDSDDEDLNESEEQE